MKKVLRKRYIRNTLMIAMIAVLCACSCFTYGLAKEKAVSNAIDSVQSQLGELPGRNQFDNSQSGEMPSFNGEDTTEFGQAPPEMQEGGNTTDFEQEAPEMQGGEDMSRPQRPDRENGERTSNSEPSEAPSDGESTTESANGPSRSENGPTQSANGPSRNDNQNAQGGENFSERSFDGARDFEGSIPEMSGSAAAQIGTEYIAILAAENLLIATVFVYLILSGFNKRGFRETLKNTKNAVIFTLSVLVLTAGITAAQVAMSTRTEVPFDMSQTRQEQMLPYSGSESTTDELPAEESTNGSANQT